MNEPEANRKSAQVDELKSILTRTGWSVEELAEKANLNPVTLKRVLDGRQPLGRSTLGLLRHAAEKALRGGVGANEVMVTLVHDREIGDQLLAIQHKGTPEDLKLLKNLIRVVYDRVIEIDSSNTAEEGVTILHERPRATPRGKAAGTGSRSGRASTPSEAA